MVENDINSVQNNPVPDSGNTLPPPVTQPNLATPAPTPDNATTPQRPIEHLNGTDRRMVILVGVVMALIIVAAAVYAYTQGLIFPTTTSTPQTTASPSASASSSATPTTSSDIQALDATATQVNSDLQDINQTSTSIDNLDVSGDTTPAL